MNLDSFAESFVRLGGLHAFGVPGGGPSLQLADALERRGVQLITTAHETTAALMAGAVGRQTGAPALALSIKGPGFINLAPGLLANAYEGNPMISISEAYPGDANAARRHKWLNHQRLAGEFLKAHFSLGDRQDVMDAGWSRAKLEFPGPVHVDLTTGDNIPLAAVARVPDDPAPLSAAIRAARCPVLIVGSCGLRAPWRKLLASLTIPLFTTPAAKGLIPEDQRNAAGIYTGDGKELSLEKQILPQADLVITLGMRPGEILNPSAPHARWIEIEQAELRDGELFPPLSDRPNRLHLSSEAIAEACAALAQHRWGTEGVVAARRRMEQAFLRWTWSVRVALDRVQQQLPSAVHVFDTGNFTVLGEHFLKAPDEHSVLGTPNGRFMGLGIGYALGASVVSKERPVVLWIGDGGVRAFFGELSLAAEQQMKLLVLVVKDGFFGSVRGRAISQGWTVAPLRVKDRGLVRLAEAMGFVAGQADSESALERGLTLWQSAGGPGLLELVVDPDAYLEMTNLLR